MLANGDNQSALGGKMNAYYYKWIIIHEWTMYKTQNIRYLFLCDIQLAYNECP